MGHEMIRTDDKNQVWGCPSCPYLITFAAGQYRNLVLGEDVPHFGTVIPNLYLGAIEVNHGQAP